MPSLTLYRPVRLVTAALLATAAVVIPTAARSAGEPAPGLAHRAELVFDTAAHTLRVSDHLAIPPGLSELRLGDAIAIERLVGQDFAQLDPRVVVRDVEDAEGAYQVLDLSRMGLTRGGDLWLEYTATFHQSVDDVEFSRENVGGEITATIGDEGIYLSAGAGWLPWAEGVMATHDLTCDTPADFETVTQGRRATHEMRGDRLWTRWIAEHPSDGINLVANRFFVHVEPAGDGVLSYTFLLEDDARLRATYHERTRAYLDMYREMIGPYPYRKFATVENWFPTGYGMPSYTLLGSQVLRLPFIPYTSFGHEIAHNWWGNSVFVDPSEGNWCEGLTVYCADYHYQEMEGPAEAREYRRNLLKDYAAYVRTPESDFPLSAFRSRHSGATRAVGYGKSMMVFHMLDRALGREAFLAGLREVAAAHAFTAAGWGDFLGVFARRGGPDPDAFRAQWLTRTGAPRLALSAVEFEDDAVRFELRQTEPVYDLAVPVVLTGPDGEQEHVLRLATAAAGFRLEGRRVARIAVDPDYHLFRHLDPAEIEPTISQILGEEAPRFVIGEADTTAPGAALRAAALEFVRGFMERDDIERVDGDALPGDGHAAVVINPGPDLQRELVAPGLEIAAGGAYLDGKRYDLATHDLVYAAIDPLDPTVSDLVILCPSPQRLAALARRIGHYGKYSWLALPTGQGRPERGNWRPGVSSLSVTR